MKENIEEQQEVFTKEDELVGAGYKFVGTVQIFLDGQKKYVDACQKLKADMWELGVLTTNIRRQIGFIGSVFEGYSFAEAKTISKTDIRGLAGILELIEKEAGKVVSLLTDWDTKFKKMEEEPAASEEAELWPE